MEYRNWNDKYWTSNWYGNIIINTISIYTTSMKLESQINLQLNYIGSLSFCRLALNNISLNGDNAQIIATSNQNKNSISLWDLNTKKVNTKKVSNHLFASLHHLSLHHLSLHHLFVIATTLLVCYCNLLVFHLL
jgi:hypothetical protein